MRHLLDIDDLSPSDLLRVLDLAMSADTPKLLAGKGAALIFEKPSARTRNSMEMAVVQLGGHPVYIQGHEVGFDTRETVEDVARTMGCFHSIVGARVFEHSVVERMAALDVVPIVNMLSDAAHPLVMRRPEARDRSSGDDVRPYVTVRPGVDERPGLEGRIARPVFYEIAGYGVEGPRGRIGVWSAGTFFCLEEEA